MMAGVPAVGKALISVVPSNFWDAVACSRQKRGHGCTKRLHLENEGHWSVVKSSDKFMSVCRQSSRPWLILPSIDPTIYAYMYVEEYTV